MPVLNIEDYLEKSSSYKNQDQHSFLLQHESKIAKVLINLCGCTGWSVHLLANHGRQVFVRHRGPNYGQGTCFVHYLRLYQQNEKKNGVK